MTSPQTTPPPRLLRRHPDLGYLDGWMWLPKSHPSVAVDAIKRALVFTSVDSEHGMRVVPLFQETEHHILVPREFWAAEELAFPIIDARPIDFPRVDIGSRITLDWDQDLKAQHPARTTQRDAIAALEAARGGILQLKCGGGKTVIAIEFIARQHAPALILVDTTVLLDQWRKELLLHTDLREEDIGLIRGDVWDWEKPVVLATYHTVSQNASRIRERVKRHFGVVVWDEAHHLAADTFMRTAPLFYGYRLLLTATPNRTDGLQVIYIAHAGGVVFKDLRPDLPTIVHFVETGENLDVEDARVLAETTDCNGEQHLGKLAGHLGRQVEHLDHVLREVRAAREADRKVLVLSPSIDELVNLAARWMGRGEGALYSDVAVPTMTELGYPEGTPAQELPKSTLTRLTGEAEVIAKKLENPHTPPAQRRALEEVLLPRVQGRLYAHEVARKARLGFERAQRRYLQALLGELTGAGLIIGEIKDPDVRDAMLRQNPVTFMINRLGQEGLNSKELDTVVMTIPTANRNTIQQVMGRPSRALPGKKQPILVVLEPEIPALRGTCMRMRRLLLEWPADEGGPITHYQHPPRGTET